jgi:hypothetical protein
MMRSDPSVLKDIDPTIWDICLVAGNSASETARLRRHWG